MTTAHGYKMCMLSELHLKYQNVPIDHEASSRRLHFYGRSKTYNRWWQEASPLRSESIENRQGDKDIAAQYSLIAYPCLQSGAQHAEASPWWFRRHGILRVLCQLIDHHCGSWGPSQCYLAQCGADHLNGSLEGVDAIVPVF